MKQFVSHHSSQFEFIIVIMFLIQFIIIIELFSVIHITVENIELYMVNAVFIHNLIIIYQAFINYTAENEKRLQKNIPQPLAISIDFKISII